ncbi:MAG: AMP-binding protein [Frankia sp.]|nr:AMP-binding protein [Frankia sp.]
MTLDRRLLAPHALAEWAAKTPDAPALVHVDGTRFTYAELLEDSRRWAGCLRAHGVDAGTHVATLLPDRLDPHRAFLGLAWLRAVEVPLNTAYVGDMLRHALTVSEASVVLTTAAMLPRISEATAGLDPAPRVLLVDDLRDELATAEPATDLPGPEVWDVNTLLFTSGTTGPSKAVTTPWGLTYQMWSWVPEDTVRPGEALHLALPLFHNSGRSGFNYALGRGGCLVTRERFSATSMWDEIRRFGCVALALVGPLTALVYSAPPRQDDADNPLRSAILGPMIPDIEGFERRFGVRVATCYGQTEVGAPLVSGFDHGPWANTGVPRESWPGFDVRLVDEHDIPVTTPGQVGELVVRAREPWSMSLGYHGMPAESAAAWRNGWFHTGDAFRTDEEGRYYFVDRMRDTIRRRGENISSFEVEAAVGQHPAVRECAAVGVRTELGDEEVMVCVILHEDQAAGFSPAELVSFLDGRMPSFMLPRYVDVVDDLPRNATTGRVRKNELRARGLTPTTWDRLSPTA